MHEWTIFAVTHNHEVQKPCNVIKMLHYCVLLCLVEWVAIQVKLELRFEKLHYVSRFQNHKVLSELNIFLGRLQNGNKSSVQVVMPLCPSLQVYLHVLVWLSSQHEAHTFHERAKRVSIES
jgi:hypothetical protein